MATDLNKIIDQIKTAGQRNVRVVPMPTQSVVDGNFQVEISESGVWKPVLLGVKQGLAEDIIRQALNRTILG